MNIFPPRLLSLESHASLLSVASLVLSSCLTKAQVAIVLLCLTGSITTRVSVTKWDNKHSRMCSVKDVQKQLQPKAWALNSSLLSTFVDLPVCFRTCTVCFWINCCAFSCYAGKGSLFYCLQEHFCNYTYADSLLPTKKVMEEMRHFFLKFSLKSFGGIQNYKNIYRVSPFS